MLEEFWHDKKLGGPSNDGKAKKLNPRILHVYSCFLSAAILPSSKPTQSKGVGKTHARVVRED